MKFLSKIIEDICILSGLSLIVGATFFISPLFGVYLLGVILTIFGLFVAKH